RGRGDLAPFSRVAIQLQEVANDPDFDLKKLLQLIQSGQALTAAILRAANSSFYGDLNEVATADAAVARLGSEEVARLAAMAAQKEQYQLEDPELQQFLEPLWRLAAACAAGSRWRAKRLGFEELENEVFVAGLLHDIGKLLLMKVVDDLKANHNHDVRLAPSLMEELFASLHPRVGYALVRSWSLPESYCLVVRDHHVEDLDPANTLLQIVWLAELGIMLEDVLQLDC
ncbi:MAG: HDOD domain-containing protein, partial [bacterium]